MLYIDDRENISVKLFPIGFQKSTKRLQYGDYCFLGKGDGGVPVPVGVERKKLMDLINSMNSGRLSGHQLPGLMTSYEVVYLIVEGLWRPNPKTGVLEIYKNRRWRSLELGGRMYTAREINNYLNTLEIVVGVHTRRTMSKMETVNMLCSLYSWWNKDYNRHKGHLAFDLAQAAPQHTLLKKPSLVRKVAKEFEGIGWERTKAIEEKFKSVKEMVLASVEDWVEIEGIGKTLANRIVEEVNDKGGK